MMFESNYYRSLRLAMARHGGMFNAHLHMDRSNTLEYGESAMAGGSHLSLSQKHGLIPSVHASPAYDPDNLFRRVNDILDTMVAVGTSRASTVTDVTCDRVKLSALEVMLDIKNKRKHELDFCVGAYSPLGFTDAEPQRWDLLCKGAEMADFIGSLPERDDTDNYPTHIGFQEHCRRILTLAARLNKSVHIHVDQRNDPAENGAELVVRVMDELGMTGPSSVEPVVWLIHVISPSMYEEARFEKLLQDLVARNIGVICCPSAAISMRQLRPLKTPTSNSIARVLEMLAAGVHVCLGSDNICDITSPSGTPDLTAELFVLSNALRFYDVNILAKVGAGLRLDTHDRAVVTQHLLRDRQEIGDSIRRYHNES
jgi:cytosine deaminase